MKLALLFVCCVINLIAMIYTMSHNNISGEIFLGTLLVINFIIFKDEYNKYNN